MPTNTKENGFETLIVNYLVEQNGFEQGTNDDYNIKYTIDESRFFRFLEDTQKEKVSALGILSGTDRTKFLERLNKQLSEKALLNFSAKA